MSNHRITFSCGHTRNKACQHCMEDTESTAPNKCPLCSRTRADIRSICTEVRKHIADQQIFDQFRDALYLYRTKQIDIKTWMEQITPHIRTNPRLITWFRDALNYDWRDDAIDVDFEEELVLKQEDVDDVAPPLMDESEIIDLTGDEVEHIQVEKSRF